MSQKVKIKMLQADDRKTELNNERNNDKCNTQLTALV